MLAAVLLYQSGRGSGFSLGWGLVGCPFGQGFLLPLEGAGPVFILFLVEFCLPFADRLFAGRAGVILLVTSNTIAVTDVVKELTLEFTATFFPSTVAVKSGRFRPEGKEEGSSWAGRGEGDLSDFVSFFSFARA
jgi:hypothetical protein